MKVAHLDIEIGDRFTLDDLREVFDRGSTDRGIEICYDESGQKYIRLFSSETGPYNDDVRSGKSTYVGEGRTGDQELKGGNRVLERSIKPRCRSTSSAKHQRAPGRSIRAKSMCLAMSAGTFQAKSETSTSSLYNDEQRDESPSIAMNRLQTSHDRNASSQFGVESFETHRCRSRSNAVIRTPARCVATDESKARIEVTRKVTI